jgi:hypothetical protein
MRIGKPKTSRLLAGVATVAVVTGVGMSAAWVTTNNSTQGSVVADPNAVYGGSGTAVSPHSPPGTVLVTVTNTLPETIQVTKIAGGDSSQVGSVDTGNGQPSSDYCPAGSLHVADLGDGTNALVQSSGGVDIQPGDSATYAMPVSFNYLADQSTAQSKDWADDQDGCVNNGSVPITLGAVSYTTS